MSDKRLIKTEQEGKVLEVIIPHPEFGHVIFTEPTPRQQDVLEDYLKCKNIYNKNQLNGTT